MQRYLSDLVIGAPTKQKKRAAEGVPKMSEDDWGEPAFTSKVKTPSPGAKAASPGAIAATPGDAAAAPNVSPAAAAGWSSNRGNKSIGTLGVATTGASARSGSARGRGEESRKR